MVTASAEVPFHWGMYLAAESVSESAPSSLAIPVRTLVTDFVTENASRGESGSGVPALLDRPPRRLW